MRREADEAGAFAQTQGERMQDRARGGSYRASAAFVRLTLAYPRAAMRLLNARIPGRRCVRCTH